MILCFNCSIQTKRSLDSIMQTGEYTDYSEVISLAITNLAVLQDEALHQPALLLQTKGASGRPAKEQPYRVSRGGVRAAHHQGAVAPSAIPEMFVLSGLSATLPRFEDPPDDVWATGQMVPIDRWLFGQYNRLLPAKASCRALAHLFPAQPRGVPLDETARAIAEGASVLGDALDFHDARYQIARDEALSTAFPLTTDPDKSRIRYASQFVGTMNRHGHVSGMLVDLKLANRAAGKEARLGLTEVGWQFGVMPNPAIDGPLDQPRQKFSADEKRLLLQHISAAVPAEAFAFRAILEGVRSGAVTPKDLDAALVQYSPASGDHGLTQAFLSSQRSGAVSRMTDLGLLQRVRDGVRVRYLITETGAQFTRERN